VPARTEASEHTPYAFADNTDRKSMEVTAPPTVSVDGCGSNERRWEFSFDRVFR
jgi:hypothetical protein